MIYYLLSSAVAVYGGKKGQPQEGMGNRKR
jgi:hypothetical protein